MNTPRQQMTGSARNVLAKAEEEARAFNHSHIGTEHLLLGLTKSPGLAQIALHNLGVDKARIRRQTEFIVGRGDRIVVGEIGYTPRSKVVLRLAVEEMHRMENTYLSTAHLLLGLIREAEGIGAGVLESLGVSLSNVRSEIARMLNEVDFEIQVSASEIATLFAALEVISDEKLVENIQGKRQNGLAMLCLIETFPDIWKRAEKRSKLMAALDEYVLARLYKILEAIESTQADSQDSSSTGN